MSIGCTRALDVLGNERAIAALQPHLETCAECRALVEAHACVRDVRTPPLDGNAAIRIREAARAELVAPRARPWWQAALVLVALTLGVGAAGAILMPHGNLASPLRQIGIGVLLAASVVCGGLAALSPRRRWDAVALAVALGAAAAVVVGGTGIYPLDAGGFWEAGLRCGRTVVLYALPSCAVALLVQRSAALSLRRGLAAGLAAGAAGALALHPHCPIGQAGHLALFHVLPWFAVAAALLLVQRRVPRGSFAP
jgi:hypothetical protein